MQLTKEERRFLFSLRPPAHIPGSGDTAAYEAMRQVIKAIVEPKGGHIPKYGAIWEHVIRCVESEYIGKEELISILMLVNPER
jgi:hypothetical protein